MVGHVETFSSVLYVGTLSVICASISCQRTILVDNNRTTTTCRYPAFSKSPVVDVLKTFCLVIVTFEIVEFDFGSTEWITAVVATNSNGRTVFMRNFKTRAERLAAAGEVYASRPGVDLDFSDDESFRTAATDLVFTLTEGELGVVAATNRVLVLSGTSPSPAALKRTLRALSAALPYLANVVCDDVSWAADSESASTVPVSVVAASTAKMNPSDYPAVVQVKVPAQVPSFPVCGVMTTPVPCLMLRNGARVLEGASFEGYTIERIEADAVTVSNATGRITWKP